MSRTTTGPGHSVGLTKSDVVAAAIGAIDEDGLEALSMRRLAERLGVTPMALYNHVADRRELEQLVVDAIVGAAEAPDPETEPRQMLEVIAHRLRAQYLAHPMAINLIQTTPPGNQSVLVPIDVGLGALRAMGWSLREAVERWTGLAALVKGHVSYQLQGHFSDPSMQSEIPNHLRNLRAAVAEPCDYEAAFVAVLDAYLGGLDIRLNRCQTGDG